MLSVARFFQLVLGGIVVGTMFAVWAGFDSRGFSYTTFVEHHQNAVLGLNILVPALASLAILLTFYIAYLQRAWRGQMVLLLVAAGCMIVAGLATRFGCQPINAIVDTWTSDAPPTDWEVLRAEWWHYHFVRMVAGTVGYSLIVFAVVRPQH
ncbi:MAG: DUF1772 domain-containing protein [Flavobacteriales bacterium]|jgi:hypothetical protein|nr:DUF1772 domain-containing protein [Flavobacteriales bacterium]MBK7101011.1 DUF1772 domain-containing protein [Flavobacteriales bacterium]MBK7483900.1 DUF1772 domain-containing protein [Flavobacteriales bacterium]MBK8707899.1 DUF1772 domain-containing protein [Flavobacteriales bacterium]MBK9629026.1 DUF1772 domain-containing protein [Flavobacteriales bacterium]